MNTKKSLTKLQKNYEELIKTFHLVNSSIQQLNRLVEKLSSQRSWEELEIIQQKIDEGTAQQTTLYNLIKKENKMTDYTKGANPEEAPQFAGEGENPYAVTPEYKFDPGTIVLFNFAGTIWCQGEIVEAYMFLNEPAYAINTSQVQNIRGVREQDIRLF